VGAWTQVDFVSFGGTDSRVLRNGVEMDVDTRVDPMLSRNAIFARGVVERMDIDTGDTPIHTVVDVAGYLPGPGTSTIVLRGLRDGVDRTVPPFLKILRGRESTLRGFRAGTAAGDIITAGTVEWRQPINSPLNIVKVGIRAFVDVGAVYDVGTRFLDQRLDRGIGGGVWATATVIRLSVDVAHGSSGSTRVVVNSGLSF
jgi:hypothetical protein